MPLHNILDMQSANKIYKNWTWMTSNMNVHVNTRVPTFIYYSAQKLYYTLTISYTYSHTKNGFELYLSPSIGTNLMPGFRKALQRRSLLCV